MPPSKYTKVPAPLRPEQITLSAFQFDGIARRELISLLPLRLQQLDVPEDIKQDAAESHGAPRLETLAELIVAYTEKLIVAYFTEVGLGDRTPTNPSNVKAAIRKLRKALEPFRGGIDEDTSSIIPHDLDKRLTDREHEVGKLRLAPYERRRRNLLCQHIGVVLTEIASANQATFETRKMLEFIATALDHAGIEHSYSKENPSRFVNLVFPKIKDRTWRFSCNRRGDFDPLAAGRNAGESRKLSLEVAQQHIASRIKKMTPNRIQTGEDSALRMYTRSDAMRILRIGETSLHWLTRTGKLQTVRIGGRVLIPGPELDRLCRKGASLSEAEKTAAREQTTHNRGRSRTTGAVGKQSRDRCGGGHER